MTNTAMADWLCLAATPCFAVMTVLTAASGMDTVCGVAHGLPPITGMALMYALMSAFHAGPWLRLLRSG